jgi:hypothetical protein
MCCALVPVAFKSVAPFRVSTDVKWVYSCRLQPDESWIGEMVLRLHEEEQMAPGGYE